MGVEKLLPVGYSPINRVGVAPAADGIPMLCYQGDEKQLDLLRNAPGVEYWLKWNCLAFPISRTNLLLLETIGQFEEATDDYVTARNEILKPPERYRVCYPAPATGDSDPYIHQIDAFCWAEQVFDNGCEGFANLCAPGLGKSRMAIDLMRAHVFQKALLVCQNSTTLQWKNYLERSWPNCRPVMLTDIPIPQRAQLLTETCQGLSVCQPAIFIVNWESLARLCSPLKRMKPEMIVMDEATRIKERRTLMAKAAHQLAAVASYRVALTGTPLGNSPADLWSIFRFVDPDIFGKNYWRFVEKYFKLGGYTGKEFVGFQGATIPDFIERLYRQAFRVTKATVCDMPEKQFEVVRLDMEPEQLDVYNQMERYLYARRLNEEGKEETLTAATALDQSVRLQQISAGVFPQNNAEGCSPIKSVKTEWLVEYIRDILNTSDSHLLVWTRYSAERKNVCAALLAAGIPAESIGYIDGSVPNKVREQLRQEFNDRRHPRRVLVCQIQAAAYGLDVPAADIMLYHSLTFSLLERNQSMERGHRLGRTRPYTIIDLVCNGTIDTKIVAALKRKQNLVNMLLVEGFATATPA